MHRKLRARCVRRRSEDSVAGSSDPQNASAHRPECDGGGGKRRRTCEFLSLYAVSRCSALVESGGCLNTRRDKSRTLFLSNEAPCCCGAAFHIFWEGRHRWLNYVPVGSDAWLLTAFGVGLPKGDRSRGRYQGPIVRRDAERIELKLESIAATCPCSGRTMPGEEKRMMAILSEDPYPSWLAAPVREAGHLLPAYPAEAIDAEPAPLPSRPTDSSLRDGAAPAGH